MTDHVTRRQTLDLIDELNHLRRVVPIYRQALATIAGEHTPDPHRTAHQALREADGPEPDTRT
jgi:hypothetical protein